MTDMTSGETSTMAGQGALAVSRQTEIPLVVWAGWTLVVMLLAAVLPFDASYDVVHYHIHNGWAAWNGRIDKDFAPANMHSFINPAFNMLVWWLIERLPGPAVNAVLAIPAAMVLPAIYYLARTLSTIMTGHASRTVCLVIAFLGFAAEGQVSIFASIRNDAWGAAAFIAALALVLTPTGRLAAWPRLLLASLLLGAVLGIKFTNLPYAMAFGLFVLLLARDWPGRLRAAAICAGAGLVAVLVFAGPYAWLLWERFGNPVFPLANEVFQSPLGPTDYDAYSRRKPGPFTLPLYPFVFTWNSKIIGSEDLLDVRFLFAYLGAIALLALGAMRLRAGDGPVWWRPVCALCVSLLAAMAFWMISFSVMRYLLAAWMLGPLMVAVLLWAVTGRAGFTPRIRRFGAAIGVALLLTTNLSSTRRATWKSLDAPYISAELGDRSRFEDAFILFTGGYPSAFLAPLFPETATFAGVVPQEYFRPALANYRPLIRKAIADAPGRPVYSVLFANDDVPPYDRVTILGKLQDQEGLRADPQTCEPIPNNLDIGGGDWFVCRVYRPGEAPFLP